MLSNGLSSSRVTTKLASPICLNFCSLNPNPVEAIKLDLPPNGICFGGLEQEVLLRALEQSNWNQSMAARYLGMSRKTLVYRDAQIQSA